MVHHKDHNKHNNTVENLEWTTHSNNTREAIKAGKHPGGYRRIGVDVFLKYTDRQIDWIRKKKLHNDGYTYTELCAIFETNRGYISQIMNKVRRYNPQDNPKGRIFL